jgi:hypothetical protein
MGNFISKTDLKAELQIEAAETEWDTLLDTLANAIENLWDRLTNRVWFKTAFVEYYDAPKGTKKIFLQNYPVVTSPAVVVRDDPDWVWGDDTIVDATDYRVDYEKGIVHYNAVFFEGSQSVKVSYTAGFAADALPTAIKQVLVRQGAHWWKQAEGRIWDVSSEAQAAGAGTVSFKLLEKNLLPEFAMMAEFEGRSNNG